MSSDKETNNKTQFGRTWYFRMRGTNARWENIEKWKIIEFSTRNRENSRTTHFCRIKTRNGRSCRFVLWNTHACG